MTSHTENINEILALHFAHERLTEEQEALLTGWMIDNKEEYHRLAGIMSPHRVESREAWTKVHSRLERPVRGSRFSVKKILSLAASVVLVVGVSLYLLRRTEPYAFEYANGGTALKTIVLPDSSSVVLYPRATLKYTAVASERKADLSGKAFFKVHRNEKQPFAVSSNDVEVKVLGTSFLVANLPDQGTEVSVKEGLVQVSSERGKVLLRTHEQARVNKGEIAKETIARPEDVFRGLITRKVYRDTPLDEVVRDLEKDFNVHIEVAPSLRGCSINTTLDFVRIEDLLGELSYICNGRYEKLSAKQYKLY